MSDKKVSYVGAPAIFALSQACDAVNAAFEGFGCYLVGSALECPDFRDVDVRFIMPDEEFLKLFPGVSAETLSLAAWELDTRWLLLTVSIAEHLAKLTGLKIDFQITPMSFANTRFKGKRRQPLGKH